MIKTYQAPLLRDKIDSDPAIVSILDNLQMPNVTVHDLSGVRG